MSTRTLEHSERGRRNGLKGLESQRARAELAALRAGVRQVMLDLRVDGDCDRSYADRLAGLLAQLSETRGNPEHSALEPEA